ncbi:MAG: hypothetical protein KGS72_01555 [Cyanobacteria bacterium REEB67]|nr:hypothetical protein [Cyanobacteria bacterium REEB67]
MPLVPLHFLYTISPAQAQLQSPLELKQGDPEPLEKGGDDDTAGGAVLPPLNLETDVGRSEVPVASPTANASANSAAIKMPGKADDNTTVAESGGDDTAAGGGLTDTRGLPSTASISASGPLNLSLPTNEYILPANSVLHGRVSENPERSPLLSGSVQTIPDGLKVDLTLQGNLNSETSQKGSEVFARISTDVTDSSGNKVYLPGGWVAHGFVTDRSGQKRHGRAGWAEVTFDKIISPDGNYDIPFEAKLSTKDNTVAAVTKIIATDTKYMSIGAAAGSVLSVQMTGIPLAVASHGYSVAIGAGIGAAIGLFGAVRHKGDILSVYPGEHLKLTTAGSIQMPGFNLANLPSAKPKERVIGIFMQVNEARLEKDAFTEDKRARILRVNFTVVNHSQREFLLNNIRVISELQTIYPPHMQNLAVKYKPLVPTSSQTVTIPFSVDAGKHNYFLLLTDAKGNEVRREPIKLN